MGDLRGSKIGDLFFPAFGGEGRWFSILIVNAEQNFFGLLGIVMHRLCHSNSFFISWIQVDIGSHDYWFAGKLDGRRRQAAC